MRPEAPVAQPDAVELHLPGSQEGGARMEEEGGGRTALSMQQVSLAKVSCCKVNVFFQQNTQIKLYYISMICFQSIA